MVQKTDLAKVRKFKGRITPTIHVDKMFLFGSRANNKGREESDFDILVVSSDFVGVPWYKRSVQLYLLWEEDFPLELLCYTPIEVQEARLKEGIIKEVFATGIEV